VSLARYKAHVGLVVKEMSGFFVCEIVGSEPPDVP
jgi:hypothetical protein